MRHTIGVPDWIWERYGRSPAAMRDVLARNLVEGADALAIGGEPQGDGGEPPEDPGRVITLRLWTRCNGCGTDLDEGARALLRTEDGSKRIYCRRCADGDR